MKMNSRNLPMRIIAYIIVKVLFYFVYEIKNLSIMKNNNNQSLHNIN